MPHAVRSHVVLPTFWLWIDTWFHPRTYRGFTHTEWAVARMVDGFLKP